MVAWLSFRSHVIFPSEFREVSVQRNAPDQFMKNTNSKIKSIQMPCLVQIEALFDEDRGLSLQE